MVELVTVHGLAPPNVDVSDREELHDRPLSAADRGREERLPDAHALSPVVA